MPKDRIDIDRAVSTSHDQLVLEQAAQFLGTAHLRDQQFTHPAASFNFDPYVVQHCHFPAAAQAAR
jgi:hypothetical protein